MKLVRLMRIEVDDATSLAAANDEQTVYVTHRGGLLHLDLKTRSATAVTFANGLDVERFERVRWYRDSLVGVQAPPNAPRRIVRLDLNRSGRTVTTATVLDASLPASAGPTFATLSGDDLYYVEAGQDTAGREAVRDQAEIVVRRIRLRR
jgi:hypothetical protein